MWYSTGIHLTILKNVIFWRLLHTVWSSTKEQALFRETGSADGSSSFGMACNIDQTAKVTRKSKRGNLELKRWILSLWLLCCNPVRSVTWNFTLLIVKGENFAFKILLKELFSFFFFFNIFIDYAITVVPFPHEFL